MEMKQIERRKGQERGEQLGDYRMWVLVVQEVRNWIPGTS